MEVVFREGFRLKNKQPETVFRALHDIRVKRGKLEARTVWEEARSPKHPLHIEFEWDDTIAAALHRDQQARKVMQSIEVVETTPEGGEIRSRAFIAVEEDSEIQYDPLDVVLNSEEKYAYALRDAKAYLEAARKKLEQLRSATDALELVTKAIKALEKKLARRKTA